MAKTHIILPAKPSFSSMEFDSYNAALAYSQKAQALRASKPHRRIRGGGGMVWAVTVPNLHNLKASANVYTVDGIRPVYTGLKLRGMLSYWP